MKLRVAVLLHDEAELMFENKFLHGFVKRKSAEPHVIESDAALAKQIDPFTNSHIAAANADDRPLRFRRCHDRRRHKVRRGLVFCGQAVEDFLVFAGRLGIVAEFVVARTARDVRAVGMNAGQRSAP